MMGSWMSCAGIAVRHFQFFYTKWLKRMPKLWRAHVAASLTLINRRRLTSRFRERGVGKRSSRKVTLSKAADFLSHLQ